MDVVASVSPTGVLSRQLQNNSGGGISVPGDPGVLSANQPVSIPGLNANLQGADRIIQANWAIQRGPGKLPLPGTATTLGKSVQG